MLPGGRMEPDPQQRGLVQDAEEAFIPEEARDAAPPRPDTIDHAPCCKWPFMLKIYHRGNPCCVIKLLLLHRCFRIGSEQPRRCNKSGGFNAAPVQRLPSPAEQNGSLIPGEIVKLPLPRRVGTRDEPGCKPLLISLRSDMIKSMQDGLISSAHLIPKPFRKFGIIINTPLVMMIGNDQERGDRYSLLKEIFQHPVDLPVGHGGNIVDGNDQKTMRRPISLPSCMLRVFQREE